MDIITIILILGIVVLVFVGGGIFAYFTFAVPAMKSAPPLTEEGGKHTRSCAGHRLKKGPARARS